MGANGAQLCYEDDGTGGPLLANESCGELKRRWMEGGVEVARNSSARVTGITRFVMPLTITIICVMHSL